MSTPFKKVKNRVLTTIKVGSDIDNIDDPVIFNITDETKFPVVPFYFTVEVINDDTVYERMLCTDLTGDQITATRAQDGTTKQTFNAGDLVMVRVIAAHLDDITTAINALEALVDQDVTNSGTPQFARLGLGAPADGSHLLILGATSPVSEILDEDDMVSNSNTALATQQSIKTYIDLHTNIVIDYYFNNTLDSGIGGIYYEMTDSDLGGGQSEIETTGLTAGNPNQPLNNFITLAGNPGVLTIPKGRYAVHFHAERSNGTSDVNIYALIYKRAAIGGAEVLIATTETSVALTDDPAPYEIHASTSVDTDLLVTDRIVIKFFANLGAGSGAEVKLYQEGTTTSHMTIPTTTDVLSQVFLRQDQNLADLNNAATARGNLVLGNVDNTSDVNKPVSTATQTALDLKANLISPSFTTPDLGTPSAGILTNCTFPTLNQNTTGTAANLSGTPALPNGTTATTQGASDNSTKLATTAYADAAGGGGEWEYVSVLTWANDTTTRSFTSLAGGTYDYQLRWACYGTDGTETDNKVDMIFNSDSNNRYTFTNLISNDVVFTDEINKIYLMNTRGSLPRINIQMGTLTIQGNRLNTDFIGFYGGTGTVLYNYMLVGGVYKDASADLTTITFSTVKTITGSIKLYRRANIF